MEIDGRLLGVSPESVAVAQVQDHRNFSIGLTDLTFKAWMIDEGLLGDAMQSLLRSLFIPFGRLSRLQFLAGLGLMVLAGPVIAYVISLFVILLRPLIQAFGATPIMMLSLSLPLWLGYCLFANRLHDINRTGAWALIPVVLPTAVITLTSGFNRIGFGWGMIMSIYFTPTLFFLGALLLLCFKGDPSPNRFGERPVVA